MKISYAITVCNELDEVSNLLNILKDQLISRPQDEICILLDTPKAGQELIDMLSNYDSIGFINLKKSEFKGNFAEWKNELNELCSGDYIFNIDADEYPSSKLLETIPEIASSASAFAIPRVNYVNDITDDHIRRWGWSQQEDGRINWPDYQFRLYKNSPSIKWTGKVHEKLTGYNSYATLPLEVEYALIHIKNINRQEKQNEFYSTF